MQRETIPVDPVAQGELALQRGAAGQQPFRAAKHDQWISAQDREEAFVEQGRPRSAFSYSGRDGGVRPRASSANWG
jgi:hypothetical protein